MATEMKYSADKTSVIFAVNVEQKQFDAQYRKTCQKYAARLEISGFRQGSVPREMVEERVGAEFLAQEALNALLPNIIRGLIDEHRSEVTFAGHPQVTQADEKNPLALTIELALLPTVELADYGAIKLEATLDEEAITVEDGEVDSIIDNLVKSGAKWERTDEPLEMGFLATITATGTVDGASILDFKKREIYLTAESRWPLLGFHDKLLGLHRGAQAEFRLTVPDDFGEGEKVGKTAAFKVIVHSAQKQHLPELNDEFVSSLKQPEIETVAQLRETITKNLRHRKASDHNKEQDESLLAQFLELSEFRISEVLLAQEKHEMRSRQEEEVKARQMSWEDFLKQSGKTEEQFDAELAQTVEDSLKRRLVYDALTEREQPVIEDAHVKMAIGEMRRDPRFASIKNMAGLEKRVRAEMAEQKALYDAKEAIAKLANPETAAEPNAEGAPEGAGEAESAPKAKPKAKKRAKAKKSKPDSK